MCKIIAEEGNRLVCGAAADRTVYGVVPKGLLTFLGSLYKEVVKTTSGTLVYRFERQTIRKKYFFLRKALCP